MLRAYIMHSRLFLHLYIQNVQKYIYMIIHTILSKKALVNVSQKLNCFWDINIINLLAFTCRIRREKIICLDLYLDVYERCSTCPPSISTHARFSYRSAIVCWWLIAMKSFVMKYVWKLNENIQNAV